MACGLLETLKFSVLELQEHLDTYNTKKEAAEQVSLPHAQTPFALWHYRHAALSLALWRVLGQLFCVQRTLSLAFRKEPKSTGGETAAVVSMARGVRGGVWSDSIRCGVEWGDSKLGVDYRCHLLGSGSAMLASHLNTGRFPKSVQHVCNWQMQKNKEEKNVLPD